MAGRYNQSAIGYDSDPKDIAFNASSQNRDHNIFTEEYYGGADAYIYIGGVLYTNISAVQFSVREQQKPIYGYSSRTYDDIATGTRIVQGVLKVPVKNPGPSDKIVGDSFGGDVLMLEEDARANIPDWIYKYKGSRENIGTENEKFLIDSKSRADISEIQKNMRLEGIEVEVTGILDFKTKAGIAEYKKKKNLVVNNKCDLELENRMNIHDNEFLYKTRGEIKLRISPDNNSHHTLTLKRGESALIQHEYNDTWVLIQNHLGRKGYVKRSEIYK